MVVSNGSLRESAEWEPDEDERPRLKPSLS